MSLLPEEWQTTALVMGVSLLLWAFFKVNSIYSYFKKRGIPYVKPIFPFGSDVRVALGKDCIGVAFDRMYKTLKGEKLGGFFLGVFPMVMITDAEYVKQILTTNFDNFHDRPFVIDEEMNPLEGHLFFLRGNKWKFLRSKFSPVFTPGNIKYMYEQMLNVSETLIEHMDKLAAGTDVIDLYETFARFATDVIGSTAFGLEPECMNNPDAKFRAMGKKYFAQDIWTIFYQFLRIAAPRVIIALKIRGVEKSVTDYFLTLIDEVIDYRKKTGVTRKDFVQLAMQLKDLGRIEVDTAELKDELSITYDEKAVEKFEITNKVLAAQSFIFYLGGFETMSTTLYFLIYMMSVHEEVQSKAREEVKRVKKKYGTFDYEALKELAYIEKCLYETLRMFPPVPFLNRECTRSFSFPDGRTIETGVHVAIPILSLHRDPRYWTNPEEFRPERFEKPPLEGTYAPFGSGPRMCIGKRYAMVEQKLVLAMLLDRYHFQVSNPSNGPVKPIQFSNSIILRPQNPLWLKITKSQE